MLALETFFGVPLGLAMPQQKKVGHHGQHQSAYSRIEREPLNAPCSCSLAKVATSIPVGELTSWRSPSHAVKWLKAIGSKMNPYTVQEGDKSRRAAVERWLYGLDQVSPAMRENIITAWITTWSSSRYETLEEMPVAYGIDFPLMAHVNEVTKIGLDLAKSASSEWDMTFDCTTLIPTLILHDVDKPLMYDRVGSEIRNSILSREIPHGVLGAMLLKELGFEHKVVSTISLHAGNSPYHGNSLDAWILHYADYFSADRMLMQMGRKPTYQK